MTLIEIPETKSNFLIEVPQTKTTKALFFLPGISGGAISERFRPLVDQAINTNFAVVRISAWNNAEDVAHKTLTDIHRDIVYVINYLQEQGYNSIFAVGKSFGGTVLLTLPSKIQDNIERQVLWSPIISIKDGQSNVDLYLSQPLGSLNSLQDLYTDENFLKKNNVLTLIIHGNADVTIPISNSEKLASIMPNCKVFPINGADHSYSEKTQENVLLENTLRFFQ